MGVCARYMISLTLDAVVHPLEFLLLQGYEVAVIPVMVVSQQPLVGVYGASSLHIQLSLFGYIITKNSWNKEQNKGEMCIFCLKYLEVSKYCLSLQRQNVKVLAIRAES